MLLQNQNFIINVVTESDTVIVCLISAYVVWYIHIPLITLPILKLMGKKYMNGSIIYM
jgi:hypothetical protein